MPFHIAIVGFPKTGTTSLLKAFSRNPETSVVAEEYCDLARTNVNDTQAKNNLVAALGQLPSGGKGIQEQQRGIKCPVGLRSGLLLSRLEQHSPRARLIVGLRHPVWFFESYYNYRVTELYDDPTPGPERIPPAESLLQDEWRGVSAHQARFEYFLSRLTDLSAVGTASKAKKHSLSQSLCGL